MFVGAAVPNNLVSQVSGHACEATLSTEFASFTLTTVAPQDFEIHARPHPNFDDQALAQFYVLIIGLRRAGLLVECTGDFATLLPCMDEPPHEYSKVVFQKIGSDHSPKVSKKFRLTPGTLVQWHDYFNALTNLDSANHAKLFPGRYMVTDHCFLWKLPDGIMIRAKVQDDQLVDHQILCCTVPDKALRLGLRQTPPDCRRTWGEAWLQHLMSGHILVGLILLDHEIGIITDRIYRYQIQASSSILRRNMTFGPGASTAIPTLGSG